VISPWLRGRAWITTVMMAVCPLFAMSKSTQGHKKKKRLHRRFF
jgi:hypothetical protein